ncbi:MAG: carbohydrate kinase family protein [Clostridia bacterium]
MKVFVAGGINTDISGTPDLPLCLRDSNIGRIIARPGGVGRNIAENLAHLGCSVQLISALGDDAFSEGLRSHCMQNGIGLDYAITLPGLMGGVYLCINDNCADMYLALNDMRAMKFLTPDRIDMQVVNSADALVLDANICDETLQFLSKHAKIPIFADPVSVAKSQRMACILPYIHTIKPNIYEARSLTSETDPVCCAKALVRMGVKRAFVSLGALGMAYADATSCGHTLSAPIQPVNTTGAGDSATAALCAAYLAGYSIERSAHFACEIASLTLMSENTVSEAVFPAIF